jgi:hypothetical protein
LTANLDLTNFIVNAVFQDSLGGLFDSINAVAAGFSFSGLDAPNLAIGASQGLTASFDFTGVAPGVYAGTLTFNGLSKNVSDLTGASLVPVTIGFSVNVTAPVPEPHEYAVAIGGLLGVMIFLRRRRMA